MNSRAWNRIAALILVTSSLVCVAPAFAAQPDPWITTKVKMSLIASPDVSGLPVNVDTYDGRVTLSGKVSSSTEKAEAERLAAKVGGVHSVRNLLQIVPSSRRKAVAATDEHTKDRVNDALKAEHSLDNSGISVKSVNQGVVLLAGKANSLSDHLRALEVADDVPGVRSVQSEIESPDQMSDIELWNDDKPAPSPGHPVSDAWITAKTKLRFMTDADIPAGDINVDTHNGNVTLFGTVPSRAVADKAHRVAHDVSGVKAVNTELRVVAPSAKKRVMANDSEIDGAIEKRLNDAGFDGANIHVEVKAAVARLTGTVSRSVDRYSAVVITRSTDGVAYVQDDLKVEPQTASK